MSKLTVDGAVPATYDGAVFTRIIRAICQQVNLVSEGRLAGSYQAQASVPASVAAAVGDFVWDSNVTVTSGTARLGWVCNVPSPTNATWQEVRVLTSNARGVLGTAVATTSGTSIDFTGIPSWVTQIEINFVGVSTNGTSQIIIQTGDSGGIEISGYLGSGADIAGGVAATSYTTGFGVEGNGAAATVRHGTFLLTLEDATQFTWVSQGGVSRSDTADCSIGSGSKSTSAALDRVRITTVGGTDAFDAGAINIRMS